MDCVSILIPFHKGIHYLKDCLDCILDQTYRNLEIIIIGGQEGENVTELLHKYVNQGFPIIYKEYDQKLSVPAARNYCLSLATGEYIYYLDSDDYIINDTIEELVQKAEIENAQIVFGTITSTWLKRENFLKEFNRDNFSYHQNQETCTIPYILRNSLSALNILIKRDFLVHHNVSMNESFIYYSDEIFVAELLSKNPSMTVAPNALYVKRYHNDPINLPSLSQIEDSSKPREYIDSYQLCLKYTTIDTWLRLHLDSLLCQYTLNSLITSMNSAFIALDKDTKHKYIAAFRNMNFKSLNFIGRHEKKVLTKLSKGKLKQAVYLSKWIFIKKKKNGFLGEKIQWYRIIDRILFRRLPIKKNWILFESFLGKNYGDSCKYIYEYLFTHAKGNYKCIWVLQEKQEQSKVKGNPTIIKRDSLRYLYYTSRCKYWVNNMRQPIWFKKRRGMIFLETWHGTPLKRLVFDMDDVHSASPLYKKNFYDQSRIWDYLLSDNLFSTEIFERAFLMNRKKILELGYPRNDILYRQDKEKFANEIKMQLKIPSDMKTLLYAPTWRDDEFYGPGQYKFTLELDLDRLQKELEGEYMLLLRTHYFIADKLDIRGKETFIRNVSSYDDIGELYLISDICITDYSSVFFDYANLKRPILFYVYDFEKYKDVLRGFYIDMETDLPGPLLFNNDEVLHAIKNIETVTHTYKEKYLAFYEKFCSLDDGHAAERVVNRVFH